MIYVFDLVRTDWYVTGRQAFRNAANASLVLRSHRDQSHRIGRYWDDFRVVDVQSDQ